MHEVYLFVAGELISELSMSNLKGSQIWFSVSGGKDLACLVHWIVLENDNHERGSNYLIISLQCLKSIIRR